MPENVSSPRVNTMLAVLRNGSATGNAPTFGETMHPTETELAQALHRDAYEPEQELLGVDFNRCRECGGEMPIERERYCLPCCEKAEEESL